MNSFYLRTKDFGENEKRVQVCIDHILQSKRENLKILVFSKSRRFIRQLKIQLQREGLSVGILDGSVTSGSKVSTVTKFNELKIDTLILHPKSGLQKV